MEEYLCPLRKKLWGKKNDMDHIHGGYRGKKKHSQDYITPSFSSKIVNINFNSPIPTKKPETQTNQVNNRTKNIPKKNYERVKK